MCCVCDDDLETRTRRRVDYIIHTYIIIIYGSLSDVTALATAAAARGVIQLSKRIILCYFVTYINY